MAGALFFPYGRIFAYVKETTVKPERHRILINLDDAPEDIRFAWKFVGVANFGVCTSLRHHGEPGLVHVIALLLAAQDILESDYPWLLDNSLKELTNMLVDETWQADQRVDLMPRVSEWGADTDYTENLPF